MYFVFCLMSVILDKANSDIDTLKHECYIILMNSEHDTIVEELIPVFCSVLCDSTYAG